MTHVRDSGSRVLVPEFGEWTSGEGEGTYSVVFQKKLEDRRRGESLLPTPTTPSRAVDSVPRCGHTAHGALRGHSLPVNQGSCKASIRREAIVPSNSVPGQQSQQDQHGQHLPPCTIPSTGTVGSSAVACSQGISLHAEEDLWKADANLMLWLTAGKILIGDLKRDGAKEQPLGENAKGGQKLPTLDELRVIFGQAGGGFGEWEKTSSLVVGSQGSVYVPPFGEWNSTNEDGEGASQPESFSSVFERAKDRRLWGMKAYSG